MIQRPQTASSHIGTQEKNRTMKGHQEDKDEPQICKPGHFETAVSHGLYVQLLQTQAQMWSTCELHHFSSLLSL